MGVGLAAVRHLHIAATQCKRRSMGTDSAIFVEGKFAHTTALDVRGLGQRMSIFFDVSTPLPQSELPTRRKKGQKKKREILNVVKPPWRLIKISPRTNQGSTKFISGTE